MPNNAGWATFEAKVRARRLAACVERAVKLIDGGHLGEAREAIAEARGLSPDAPEIAELEQRINSRPSPGAILLATPDEPTASVAPIASVEDRAAPAREWPRVMVAVTVVVALFFISGYGVVKFRHRFALPDFSATEEMTPAPDTPAVEPRESRAASRAPEPEPPAPSSVVPPAPALVPEPAQAQPSTVPSAATSPRPADAAGRSTITTRAADRTTSKSARAVRAESRAPGAAGHERLPAAAESIPGSSGKHRDTASEAARRGASDGGCRAGDDEPHSHRDDRRAAHGDARRARPGASTAGESRRAAGESRHDESLRIRAVLLRYESAYNRLDAKAARTVWPGVNESALNRAFSGLVSQKVSLGLCDITVFGDIAGASCAGKARWEPKVGGGLQTADRYWTFQLTKSGEGWNIKEVLVR